MQSNVEEHLEAIESLCLKHFGVVAKSAERIPYGAGNFVYRVECGGRRLVAKLALAFYKLVFCLDFKGEQGQQFNMDAKPDVDPHNIALLKGLFESLCAECVLP